MKKLVLLLVTGMLLGNLCACGAGTADQNTSQAGISGNSDGQGNKDAVQNISAQDIPGGNEASGVTGGLTPLIAQTGLYNRYCYTDSGFYYMTQDEKQLADGSYGYHLMYMDYASCQEVYLCSDSSCQHNTRDCTSVFADVSGDGRIFIWDGYLYYLDRDYDSSGSTVFDFMGNSAVSVEAKQAALYRMNLDGSERKQVYSFEADTTVEDVAFGGEEGLYFITKKLGTSEIATGTYTTTTDRQVVCLDLDSKKAEPVCSLDFGDGLDWDIIGCSGDGIVLKVYQYPDGITDQEAAALDDNSYRDMLKDTKTVYAMLDLSTGEKTQIYTQSKSGATSEQVLNGFLYTSNSDSEDIVKVDLATGEEKVLTSLSHNHLYSTLGNMLLCTGYNMADDYGYYFVDTATGRVTYCSLTTRSLGWRLDLLAVTGSRVLVVYDYEYTDNGDGSYDISRYQYGLIELKDLLHSVENYTPVQMIGEGI